MSLNSLHRRFCVCTYVLAGVCACVCPSLYFFILSVRFCMCVGLCARMLGHFSLLRGAGDPEGSRPRHDAAQG